MALLRTSARLARPRAGADWRRLAVRRAPLSGGAPRAGYSLDEDQQYPNMDDVIARTSQHPLKDVTLQELVKFGRQPIRTELLLKNARYIKSNILSSLSRRIVALRNLPYIMVLNPNISQIYHKYIKSLYIVYDVGETLDTADDNLRFVAALEALVEQHTDTIPTLAKGFMEAQTYIQPAEVDRFLNEHLHDRVGTRLLAKHHVALTRNNDSGQQEIYDRYIGAVDLQVSPAEMLVNISSFLEDISDLQYGVRPSLEIDNGADVTLAYVPDHLEYILTELLKNSYRASVETFLKSNPTGSAYVFATADRQPHKVLATVVKTRSGVAIRLRDQGGGISDDNLDRIWGYSVSTFEEEERDGFKTLNTPPPSVTGTGGSSMGGLGYGLPLSRAYAEYFGGSISLQSCFGWGTDAYVHLPGAVVR
ncbi:branched-chain alpha-ketoacid dehydrogenase kinase [Dipodascopsis tothii]|uniref:branched-chain alpha-ketoacid dehydrogenase kinase n=1 Tax=Dipodascopsis tothii TaxID=44089 RepID=UPI0034CD5A9D